MKQQMIINSLISTNFHIQVHQQDSFDSFKLDQTLEMTLKWYFIILIYLDTTFKKINFISTNFKTPNKTVYYFSRIKKVHHTSVTKFIK